MTTGTTIRVNVPYTQTSDIMNPNASDTAQAGISSPQVEDAITTAFDVPCVMHVLHTLHRAGAEMLVADFIEAQRHAFRFIVVALDDGGDLAGYLKQMGISVYILNRRAGLDMSCSRQIASLARRHNVNIIHAHQYTPFFYSALARMAGAYRVKLIFTEHGRHFPDIRRIKRTIINKLILNRLAHRVTAVGEFVKTALIANEAMNAGHIEVIYNGIKPERFGIANEVDRVKMRERLGLSNDDPVILQVGGLRPVKDHTTSICAMRMLHDRGIKVVLLIAGSGPMRDEIESLITSADLDDYVRMLGSRDDIAELWCAADIGLLTSQSEGISVALLEGMASGKPMVATDVGGNAEIIIQGKTGLLAPREDARSIADALQRLIIDPTLREQFGAAGKERVCQHFNQRDMHRRIVNMYRDVENV